MAVGLFFSEVGSDFLRLCLACDRGALSLRAGLLVDAGWDVARFRHAAEQVHHHLHQTRPDAGDLAETKHFLGVKQSFLLALLANPNLLEHDTFSDMLWSVLHLAQELAAREDLLDLPSADMDHLASDMERAYRAVIGLWLAYMQHLKSDYPYLYSFATRTSPFLVRPEVQLR